MEKGTFRSRPCPAEGLREWISSAKADYCFTASTRVSDFWGKGNHFCLSGIRKDFSKSARPRGYAYGIPRLAENRGKQLSDKRRIMMPGINDHAGCTSCSPLLFFGPSASLSHFPFSFAFLYMSSLSAIDSVFGCFFAGWIKMGPLSDFVNGLRKLL